MSENTPMILRAGPGCIVTDRPIGSGPVIVYVEDFPSMALKPGDVLRLTGNGWQADAVAKLRHPTVLLPRRKRRANKRARRRMP